MFPPRRNCSGESRCDRFPTPTSPGAHAGGRVWTEQLSDGTPFDIGGAWVADEGAQSNIRALMKELGVETYRQFTNGSEGKTKFVGSDGKVSAYQPLSGDPLQRLPKFGCLAQLDVGTAILALNAMSEAVNPEEPWEDVAFDLPLNPTPISNGTGRRTNSRAATTRPCPDQAS